MKTIVSYEIRVPIKKLVAFYFSALGIATHFKIWRTIHRVKRAKAEVKSVFKREGDFILCTFQILYQEPPNENDPLHKYNKKMGEKWKSQIEGFGGKLDARIYEIDDHDIS